MTESLPQFEIEARLLYSVIVAGKSAKFADRAMRQLLLNSNGEGPLTMVRRLVIAGELSGALRMARTGNYKRIEQCFKQIASSGIDPVTCTIGELENIHGIGSKTARFFILWTRPGARHAALDVHVLRWLRANGHDAPKTTPPKGSRKYAELERAFLSEADRRGVTPRELDAEIWDAGSGYKQEAVA